MKFINGVFFLGRLCVALVLWVCFLLVIFGQSSATDRRGYPLT